jgi:hypothetical protein
MSGLRYTPPARTGPGRCLVGSGLFRRAGVVGLALAGWLAKAETP